MSTREASPGTGPRGTASAVTKPHLQGGTLGLSVTTGMMRFLRVGGARCPKSTKSEETERLRGSSWDFPGGPVVKNLPSNAGDTGSVPDWGPKIPHATGKLSPLMATKESLWTTTKTQCNKK